MIGSLKAYMIGFVTEMMNRYFFETPLLSYWRFLILNFIGGYFNETLFIKGI